VHLEDLLALHVRERREDARLGDASVVDDPVEAVRAGPGDRVAHEGVHLLGDAHLTGAPEEPITDLRLPEQLLDHRRTRAAAGRHAVAVGQEPADEVRAEPAAASGHQDVFALHRHPFLPEVPTWIASTTRNTRGTW